MAMGKDDQPIEDPTAKPGETFIAHVARLHDAKSWSQTRLIKEASTYEFEGAALDTIRNAVQGRSRRNGGDAGPPAAVIIEAIAKALGIDPMVFGLYRVRIVLDSIDPTVVGEMSAVSTADAMLSIALESPGELAEKVALRLAEQPTPTESVRSRRNRKDRGA